MAQPKNKMLDCWCQKQEALTMTAEFAIMRIAKIRNDLSYSRQDLNSKLGLKEKEEITTYTSAYASWLEIK